MCCVCACIFDANLWIIHVAVLLLWTSSLENLNLPLFFVTGRFALLIYLSLNKWSKAADCCQIHMYSVVHTAHTAHHCWWYLCNGNKSDSFHPIHIIIVLCAKPKLKLTNAREYWKIIVNLRQTITQSISDIKTNFIFYSFSIAHLFTLVLVILIIFCAQTRSFNLCVWQQWQ